MNPFHFQKGYQELHNARLIRERNSRLMTLIWACALGGLIGLAAILVASQWR